MFAQQAIFEIYHCLCYNEKYSHEVGCLYSFEFTKKSIKYVLHLPKVKAKNAKTCEHITCTS